MMTGLSEDEYKREKDEWAKLQSSAGVTGAHFDYMNMKNPYAGKDVSYNFTTCQYEGEDKDFELPIEDRVIFPKN